MQKRFYRIVSGVKVSIYRWLFARTSTKVKHTMSRQYQTWFLIGSGIIGMLLYIQAMLLAIGHHVHVPMERFSHQLDLKFQLALDPQTAHLKITPPRDFQQNSSTRALPEINDESDLPLNNTTSITKQRFLQNYEKAIESGRVPPLWQKELYQRIISNSPPETKFYLTHLLMVRVYKTDLAKWTYRELKQWMHYMFMIGIEHIYLCEHKHLVDEDMQTRLSQYIHLGLVTYSEVTTQRAMTAQVECYQKWTRLEGNNSQWMTSVDMDEYPYHLQDKEEGFLNRYLKDVEADKPYISEILMGNYLMLGQGDRSKNMTIDRIRRCTPEPLNKLVKPIFKPACVMPQIHSGVVKKGRRMPADPSQLRMLHYWGARMQKWGPDTEKVLQLTEPFNNMVNDWVDRLRNSLLCFGENDAFSNNTGP